MLQYLIPFAIWTLATAWATAPSASVPYFSAAQLAQVAMVLLAPMVFRKAGLTNGVAWMMVAAAVSLACLAARPAGAAMMTYVGYMAFQWMSEPGLSTLLMNNVKERERGGASAVNYLVMFGFQALAALVGGAVVNRFGYGVALAAGLFQGLLGGLQRAPRISR